MITIIGFLWIRKQIFEYEPAEKVHHPRAVVIVCDATFYGKKKDKLGTLVFKDILSKRYLSTSMYKVNLPKTISNFYKDF